MNSPDTVIAACTASHRRLEAGIAGLTDHQARQPSLLPGWNIGHLLTHLARNADGQIRMFEGAAREEVATQYVGGAEGRTADIEAGAGRAATELIADVTTSNARLEVTWAETTERAWAGAGLSLGGELPCALMPYRRLVETELHHIDLGRIGEHEYSFADLPNDFVGLEIRRLTALWASRQPMGLATLPATALELSAQDRLAWLVGRIDVAGLAPAGVVG